MSSDTSSQLSQGTLTQGHVALYTRDGRWRRAVTRNLGETGHSFGEASTPEELQRMLVGQRFDVLALKVRDDREASELAQALESVRLPLHTIVVGSAAALLQLPRRRTGTFRFVPGPIAARELGRLVDVTISAGTWDEANEENSAGHQLEEVDLEEAIERAAATVYTAANRKRQRFYSTVVGPYVYAFADPVRLRQALIGLLGLSVSLAPYRALISVEAQAGRNEWLIRISGKSSGRPARKPGQVTEALGEEAKTLRSIARAVAGQGGMLWVELVGSSGVAFSMTLPLPPEGARTASA